MASRDRCRSRNRDLRATRDPDLPGGTRTLITALGIYLRSAPRHAVARVVLAASAGLTPVLTAWLTKAVIDDLTAHRVARIGTTALAIGVFGAMSTAAQYFSRYLDREIARRVTLHTQATLFAAVAREQGLARLEDPAYHDRIRIAQQASLTGPQQLTGTGLSMVQGAFTIGGFVVSLWTLSPLITVMVLASVGPTLAAQLVLARQRGTMTVRIAPNTRRQIFYATLLLDLRAAKEIRLFGLGRHFRTKLLDELSAGQHAERRVDRNTLALDGSLSLLTSAISAFALYATALRIAAGHGQAGDLAVLVAALAGVQGSLAGIVSQIATAGQTLTLFAHFAAALAAPPDLAGAAALPTSAPVPAPAPALVDRIELSGVWFRYTQDGDWILSDLDLTLHAGTSTALVGLNGAGKSTLVKLLCRLYEPTRGTITWNGVDLREIDPAALRARTSTVFQDFMCYELTAAENVALGNLEHLADPVRIEAAAAAAGIHERLAALPSGYATMLSRTFANPSRPGAARPAKSAQSAGSAGSARSTADGVILSGGQWQRVALARALLRPDADLLILDEPSSGLDAEAEAEIHERLRRLRAGRTSLLITHRLGTVREADTIVVLEHGHISETGTHQQLINSGGTYAKLFRLQAEGYRDAACAPAPPKPTTPAA